MPTKDQALYRHVLRDALRLAWQRRYLWFFAFFAMFLSTGGLVDGVLRAMNDVTTGTVARINPVLSPQLPELLAAMAPRALLAPPAWMVMLAVPLLIVFGALVWFSVIGQGALVWGIGAADAKTDPRQAIGRGISSFWSLLGINLLAKLALAFAAILTAAPLGYALTADRLGANVLSFLAFILFIVLVMAVNVTAFFAIVDATLERSSLWHSLGQAIATFRTHWLVTVETAVVIFAVDILLAVGLLVGLLLLLVPFTIFFLMLQIVGSAAGVWYFLALLGVILLCWVIALVSFATTFRYAVWTLLFARLQSKPAQAKIIRILKSVPEIFRHAANRA